MGSKQTKLDEIYVPSAENGSTESPKLIYPKTATIGDAVYLTVAEMSELTQRKKEFGIDQPKQHPLGTLKKRLLKGFIYNLNDPRSPSTQLNRTPLFFEDSIDRTLDLNDTFADLFVESQPVAEGDAEIRNASTHDAEMQVDSEKLQIVEHLTAVNDSQASASFTCEEVSLDCEVEECNPPIRPIQPQQQFDPRSPTIGVDRTPIMFSDDDEANEDAMLENILATLSLDMSGASTDSCSGTPPTSNPTQRLRTGLLATETNDNTFIKLPNKHLERVRLGRKRQPRRKLQAPLHQRVYEDNVADSITAGQNATPKQNSIKYSTPEQTKRTPLSCVKNRPHLRSRSVETSVKSVKARLSLTSYDDYLNPAASCHVANLRIMQDPIESS